MEYTTLQVERRAHVTWVTLNRPDRLNAMNRVLVSELRSFLSGLGEDTHTRVVILRGAGRAFCAGLDLKEGAPDDTPDGGSVPAGLRSQRRISELVMMMRRA